MSEFKTCDLWVEHLDKNTRHNIDQEIYEIVSETWGHAVSAGRDEITRLHSENEALKAANRDLQDWFDDARAMAERTQARIARAEDAVDRREQELQKAEARVAELESQARQFICSGTGPLSYEANSYLSVMILRKQAEAMESAVRELMPGRCGSPDDPSPEFNAACEMCADFSDYAQRIYRQAELENVNNE